MRPTARVDVDALIDALVAATTQWWFWAILIVIAAIVWWLFFSPDPKVKASPDYPTDDRNANDVALGYLQIKNALSGRWNDPSAGDLSEGARMRLSKMWGLDTREDWEANIQRLVTDRRRRDLWVQYLELRSTLASPGNRPTEKAWVSAMLAAGADKRDARMFAASVEVCEHFARKTIGSKFIDRNVWVKSFDAYALGQAVAMATWGVSYGYATVEEARSIISDINDIARKEYSSWQEFGLSYAVGRAMHWSDGVVHKEEWAKRYDEAARTMHAALNPRQNGPWAALSWNR